MRLAHANRVVSIETWQKISLAHAGKLSKEILDDSFSMLDEGSLSRIF
jgi:hypothetical protein